MEGLDPSTIITTALTGFSADAAVVVPVALGIGIALWGVKKLVGFAKGFVR